MSVQNKNEIVKLFLENESSIVVIYELQGGYKTFKFKCVKDFIKTGLTIIDNCLHLPTIYISSKNKKYNKIECELMHKFIYNIYMLIHKFKLISKNKFHKNLKL